MRISLLAVPRIAVAYTMRSGALSPPGLALVARCTSPLLPLKLLSPSEPPSASVVHARLLLGGTLLGVALAADPQAECAKGGGKRKVAPGTNASAAPKKKVGPALSDIETALDPNQTYQVEKLVRGC